MGGLVDDVRTHFGPALSINHLTKSIFWGSGRFLPLKNKTFLPKNHNTAFTQKNIMHEMSKTKSIFSIFLGISGYFGSLIFI